MLITALAIAVAAGMLYAVMLVPLALAFCLALLLIWRAVQYGF